MKPGHLLISAFLLALVIGIACTKGNTAKKPQLSLVSITKTVQTNDSMTAVFKFENSGGTLGSGYFVSIRNRTNQVPPFQQLGSDTLWTAIPDFNGAAKGNFTLVLDYDDYLGESQGSHINDTMTFRFYAVNADTLYSTDTITSPQIVVINP
jgi:hypothetical protein